MNALISPERSSSMSRRSRRAGARQGTPKFRSGPTLSVQWLRVRLDEATAYANKAATEFVKHEGNIACRPKRTGDPGMGSVSDAVEDVWRSAGQAG